MGTNNWHGTFLLSCVCFLCEGNHNLSPKKKKPIMQAYAPLKPIKTKIAHVKILLRRRNKQGDLHLDRLPRWDTVGGPIEQLSNE